MLQLTWCGLSTTRLQNGASPDLRAQLGDEFDPVPSPGIRQPRSGF